MRSYVAQQGRLLCTSQALVHAGTASVEKKPKQPASCKPSITTAITTVVAGLAQQAAVFTSSLLVLAAETAVNIKDAAVEDEVDFSKIDIEEALKILQV
jgi:hypothetical protein